MQPLITTEIEEQLLRLERADEEELEAQPPSIFEEKEIGRRHALRLLDIFYDVHRECVHINLGLIPDRDDELGS